VARGKDASIVLKPVGPILYDAQNASGTRVVLGGPGTGRIGMRRIPFPGSDVTASFDLAAFKAMPPGDVEVVLFVVDTGEHKCRISGKERQAIR
jgi:hypothetical protein